MALNAVVLKISLVYEKLALEITTEYSPSSLSSPNSTQDNDSNYFLLLYNLFMIFGIIRCYGFSLLPNRDRLPTATCYRMKFVFVKKLLDMYELLANSGANQILCLFKKF